MQEPKSAIQIPFLFSGFDVNTFAAADFQFNLIDLRNCADAVGAGFDLLEAGGAQHVDQRAAIEHLGHARAGMKKITPAVVQGDALQEFFRGERIGIGEVFAGAAFEVGDDDAHCPPGLENLPAIFRERQGFVTRELVKGVRQVDVLHGVGREGKAFADIVALDIPGPGGSVENRADDRNAREQDGGGVVEVVPTGDSGEAAADVEFDFAGGHVTTC